jgi:hypothetical protein
VSICHKFDSGYRAHCELKQMIINSDGRHSRAFQVYARSIYQFWKDHISWSLEDRVEKPGRQVKALNIFKRSMSWNESRSP